MNILFNKLPKDLVYIIEDYAKDRSDYDKVVDEFNTLVFIRIEFCFGNEYAHDRIDFGCELFRQNENIELTFNEKKKENPEWYDKHIEYLDKFVNRKNFNDLLGLYDWRQDDYY